MDVFIAKTHTGSYSHVYMHTHMSIYPSTYTNTNSHKCLYTKIPMHTHHITPLHVQMHNPHIQTHTFTHICICTSTQRHTPIHSPPPTDNHKNTHVHTYPCTYTQVLTGTHTHIWAHAHSHAHLPATHHVGTLTNVSTNTLLKICIVKKKTKKKLCVVIHSDIWKHIQTHTYTLII